MHAFSLDEMRAIAGGDVRNLQFGAQVSQTYAALVALQDLKRPININAMSAKDVTHGDGPALLTHPDGRTVVLTEVHGGTPRDLIANTTRNAMIINLELP